MQEDQTVQGAGTIPSRRWLNALPPAITAIAVTAVVALVVWVVPLATSGVEAEDAIPKAETPWVTLYDDEGNAHLVHHVRTGGAEDAPPWVRLYDKEGNVHLVPAP
jgi:hypothetical protein